MKINILTQLTKIVAQYKPDRITFLKKGAPDRTSQLYTYLLEDENPTENGAIQHIYGSADTATFRKLKTRLEDKLMSMLFFVDLRGPKYSSSLKSMTECYRQMTLYFILMRFSQNELAIPLGEKLVKRAKKTDQVEVLLPVLQTLRLHYAAESFNYKKSEALRKELEAVKQTVDDRYYTEQIYCDIYSRYSQSRASQKRYIEKIHEETLPKIRTIQQRSNSFFVQRRCYNILVLFAQISGDIEQSFKYCNEAIDYFIHKSPIQSYVTIINYLIQKMVLNIRVKRYQPGFEAFDQGLKMTPAYSRDWNILHYLRFLLGLHCKKYSDALHTYEIIRAKKNFTHTTPYLQELYYIHEAYVYFTRNTLDLEQPRTLTPTKYLNNIPSFTKDKKGNNVTVLIGHFILLILNKHYDQAIERVDALRQYSHRYLRSEDSKRSRIFINMLICIVYGHFHPKTTVRHAQKHIAKLRKTDSILSEQSIELEIIPYEDLWEMLLHLLDKYYD